MNASCERVNICPKCGQAYSEHPALSRYDNATLICPDCGTREALTDIGISLAEQEQIIEVIHRCRNHN